MTDAPIAASGSSPAYTHVWRWRTVADPNRPQGAKRIPHPLAPRFGQGCREILRGSNGNLLIEFEDGYRTVAPRHALRRVP